MPSKQQEILLMTIGRNVVDEKHRAKHLLLSSHNLHKEYGSHPKTKDWFLRHCYWIPTFLPERNERKKGEKLLHDIDEHAWSILPFLCKP